MKEQGSDAFAFLDNADWKKTSEVMGRLTGSVLGGFVSERLALSLGMRVVTVIGGYYSGAFIGLAAFALVRELSSETD